uniref:Uncharacterized protein n=1 Tax=Micrurus corallinus TaxID=54390 RepID=A0A2D4GP29_MICCO
MLKLLFKKKTKNSILSLFFFCFKKRTIVCTGKASVQTTDGSNLNSRPCSILQEFCKFCQTFKDKWLYVVRDSNIIRDGKPFGVIDSYNFSLPILYPKIKPFPSE